MNKFKFSLNTVLKKLCWKSGRMIYAFVAKASDCLIFLFFE